MPQRSNELKGLQAGAQRLSDRDMQARTRILLEWANYLEEEAVVLFLFL
jgi:hypothetical protein